MACVGVSRRTAHARWTKCGSTGSLWTYNSTSNKYVAADTLLPGRGYWFKAGSACTIAVSGTPNSDLPPLRNGWNMIGSLSKTTRFVSMKGNCTVTSGPWAYNSTTSRYDLSTTLEPGQAYWVKASKNCKLNTSAKACSDGTVSGQCSATKPMYCSSGTLISSCSQCGCSSGTCQSDGTCKQSTSTCSGTISVSNADKTCGSSKYTVTAKNSGSLPLTTDIVDEIWGDANCDGSRDSTTAVDGNEWTSVTIPAGGTVTDNYNG